MKQEISEHERLVSIQLRMEPNNFVIHESSGALLMTGYRSYNEVGRWGAEQLPRPQRGCGRDLLSLEPVLLGRVQGRHDRVGLGFGSEPRARGIRMLQRAVHREALVRGGGCSTGPLSVCGCSR